MSLVFIIYIAGVIASLSKFAAFIFIATCIIYGIYCIIYALSGGEIDSKFRKWPLYVILSVGFIGAVLPSERTMWMMAGAYTGEKVMESTIGKQTLELIELKLAEELEVLKGKAKEKTK
jgi:hypothetical protein